MTINVRL